jgi:hypothetical protein
VEKPSPGIEPGDVPQPHVVIAQASSAANSSDLMARFVLETPWKTE